MSIRQIGTLTLVLFSLFVHAQSLLWDDPIDVAPEDAGTLRPRIAVNASGDPVVLWATPNDACYAAMALNDAFMPPVRLNPEGTTIAAADWQGPSLTAVGDVLWAVYKGLPEEGTPCYLVGSTNGGASWGDTLRVDPLDGLVSRYPSVAATTDGSPVVEYMQFTSGYLEPRHVVRTWMGDTPMDPVQVSTPFAPGEVCDCCTGEVAVGGSNTVVLYRNAGGNIRTIWGAASVNGGMSFPTGAEVDGTDWLLGACPSSGPDLYIAGDSIRYVWMSGAENGTKVYIGSTHKATLANGAQGFVHPGQPQSTQQNFPRIAGKGDTLGVVWERSASGNRDILFSWSVSGSTGLSEPVVVNTELTGQQRTPDLAFANGAFHIVWSEPASGQVRYRKAEISSSSAIDEGVPGAMQLRYDASSERLVITGITPRVVRILDLTGKEVLAGASASPSLALDALTGGTYLVQAVDERGATHVIRFTKQ